MEEHEVADLMEWSSIMTQLMVDAMDNIKELTARVESLEELIDED